jgi:hypothetical protein
MKQILKLTAEKNEREKKNARRVVKDMKREALKQTM